MHRRNDSLDRAPAQSLSIVFFDLVVPTDSRRKYRRSAIFAQGGSGPIFRTGGRNLEGCVRETEISLQTESAAVWSGERCKALETRE